MESRIRRVPNHLVLYSTLTLSQPLVGGDEGVTQVWAPQKVNLGFTGYGESSLPTLLSGALMLIP